MPKVTDAHRAQRRQQILDAAIACFDRRGLHGTTTDHIVAEAGLSAGAIYRYFDSKDAIIEAIASDRHDRERALVEQALEGDDIRIALRAFVNDYFDWLADPEEQRRRRINVHVWAEALIDPRLEAVITSGLSPLVEAVRAVSVGVRSAELPSKVDPESFVRVILALIQGFILQQAWNRELDPTAYRATVLAMIDSFLGENRPPGFDRTQE